MAQKVPCPNCRTRTEWSADNPYRPFCSERCKLADLGDWFSERRQIPGQELPPEWLDELDEDTPRH